jgi:hypothetical protein
VILRKVLFFSLLLLFFFSGCASVNRGNEEQNGEITEGNIHLILNERTGGFSLFYLSDPETMLYEPLFNSRSQRASYASVIVDRKTYHLGGRHFPSRLENRGAYPAIVFESPTLTITQFFTPVTTINSSVVNGIMIDFLIQNTGSEIHSVGLRMLIDTELRERGSRDHFITENLNIRNETLLSGADGERYWINRGNNVSLMGSITNPLDQSAIAPDYVHFANWRMLNESRWRLRHLNRRSFMGDSAVSYIFEPTILESGNSFIYTIFLTAEDIEWYDIMPVTVPSNVHIPVIDWAAIDETQAVARGIDLSTLVRLQELLNRFIAGEVNLGEQDLLEIERTIERYRDLLR